MSFQGCEIVAERSDGPTHPVIGNDSKQDFASLSTTVEAENELHEETLGEQSSLIDPNDERSGVALNDKNCNPAQTDNTSCKGRNAIGDIATDKNSSCRSSTSTVNLEDEENVLLSGNLQNERTMDRRECTSSTDESSYANMSPGLETGSLENLIPTNRKISNTSSNERYGDVDKALESEDSSGLDDDPEQQRLCLNMSELGSPTSDITEPELLQAERNRTSFVDIKSGKDSAYSESPCSDFSAASSVKSCAEDSGISSTVRDEELEEINLTDSNGYNSGVFHEMSRLTTDDFVSSWVPKSLNTYAPNISKGSANHNNTDGARSKQSGFKALFSRSGDEGGQNSAGWKLFGKIPPKGASNTNDEHGSTLKRDDVKRRSFGESSTTPTTKPKFLSLKRQSAAVPSSTTALIFENRPSNLPAKSPTEEKKHRQMYEAMVAEAKKKELRDKKRQEKEMKKKSKQEKGIASAASVWINEILPNWETTRTSRKAKELWWQGLPPSVRGKIWKLAIGNDLQITYELFDIFQSHAYEKLIVTRNHRKKSKSSSVAQLPTNDYPVPVVSSEHKVELIMLDVSRTFPSLCIFQENGPFHDVLHSILGAYTCYRPDVGYVQGMSFIAAVLLLNMDPPDAFVCFANLLNKPCQLAFFRVDHPLMKAYFAAFEILLHEFLNKVFVHFSEESFSPDMYLIDWIFTLFSKSLPLDVACRVWDVFCRDGDDFLFRTALGILKFYQDDLLEMDFIHLGQFLSKLPDDIPANNLFDCISSVNLTKQKFNQILSSQKELATQIKTVTASAAK